MELRDGFDGRDTYMQAASRTRELKMLEKQKRLVEELKAARSMPSLDERIIKDTAPSNRKWTSSSVCCMKVMEKECLVDE